MNSSVSINLKIDSIERYQRAWQSLVKDLENFSMPTPKEEKKADKLPLEDLLNYLEMAEEQLEECGLKSLAQAVAQAREMVRTPPTFEINAYCPVFRVSHGPQGTWEFEQSFPRSSILDPRENSIQLEIQLCSGAACTYLPYKPFYEPDKPVEKPVEWPDKYTPPPQV